MNESNFSSKIDAKSIASFEGKFQLVVESSTMLLENSFLASK